MRLFSGCRALAVIGEFMLAAKSKSARELFYECWKAAVFKFCLLVTGTKSRAEESSGDICVPELSPCLLRFAFRAAQESFSPPPLEFRLKVLEYNIFLLPIPERVAFIIWHALDLPLSTAGVVLDLSAEEVQSLCCSALIRLRESLPAHCSGGSGPALKSAATPDRILF